MLGKFYEHKPESRLHDLLYTGVVWYVDGDIDQSVDGSCPTCAFKTIGEAFTAASDGDAIRIKAGTYTETGLDLTNNSVELYFEIGCTIDPATGTGLVITGDACKIEGNWVIDVPAGEIGLQVTGDNGYFRDGIITNGGTGLDVTGTGNYFVDLLCEESTAYCYNIRGAKTKFKECHAIGAGASSYGYYINNNVDTGVLDRCTSTGNVLGGYYINSGSEDWTIVSCTSGGGDGKWRDIDSNNTWNHFAYNDEIFKEMDIPGATSVNLFKITGAVKIEYIWGHVTTATGANTTGCDLFLYDDTPTTVQLTSAGGQDLSNLPANSVVSKTATAATALTKSDATTCWLSEPTGFIFAEFAVGELTGGGGTTYIKFNQGGAGTTGTIHWHVKWSPLTGDGNVEPA